MATVGEKKANNPEIKANSPEKKVNIARPKRTPLGRRNRLTFNGMDPNYKYRVINDTDDRIKLALEAGYSFVESEEELGEERVAEGSSIASHVSKPVGNSTTGYLMRLPKALYEEDQLEKQKRVDGSEKAMDAKKSEKDSYGEGLLAK